MRPVSLALAGLLLIPLAAAPAIAQQKGLEGKWAGTISSPQGDTPTSATVTKNGTAFTATMNLMNGDVPMTNIKVVGDTLTSQVSITAGAGGGGGGGPFLISFRFVAKGDTLSGQGSLDANGQPFSFPVVMHRVAAP